MENVTWTNGGCREAGGTPGARTHRGQGRGRGPHRLSLFIFSEEACLWPKWLPGASHGDMAAFVKSDPLPVPWARHHLMKSCLPLAGAAVFKISLKTHPRWPWAAHFLYQEHTTHPSWAARSPWQGDALIDSKLRAPGSSPPPLCLLSHAVSHWSRSARDGFWRPERGLAESNLCVWGGRPRTPCPRPWTRTSRCASRTAGPACLPGRCHGLRSGPLPSRWNFCELSLAPNKHLGSAACSHLCVLCIPYPVLPGQPT